MISGCAMHTPCSTAMCGCFIAHVPCTVFVDVTEKHTARNSTPVGLVTVVMVLTGVRPVMAKCISLRICLIPTRIYTVVNFAYFTYIISEKILKLYSRILNVSIDTKIIVISCVVTKILTKTRFSIMAALICVSSTNYLCDLN